MRDLDASSSALCSLLIDAMVATEDQLQEIYDEHLETGKPFREVLLNFDIVDEDELLHMIADQLGTEYIENLDKVEIPYEIVSKVSGTSARMYGIIPLKEDLGTLHIVAKDAMDYRMVDELNYVTGQDCHIVVGKPSEIDKCLEKYYPEGEESFDAMLAELTEDDIFDNAGGENISEKDLADMASNAPIIKFVELVLYQAIKDKASDIHFEPFKDVFRIRYRIDGALYEMPPPPVNLALPVISRIKVLSGLNIAERRVPQDGRIELRIAGKPVDLRVSTLPTMHGESVVLRVLDRSSVKLDLDTLGFDPKILQKLKEIIKIPNGILAVTGPTGSGKTTTLYGCLNNINTIEDKILTAEDPVEYDIDGIMQVPIKDSIGMTFAKALKAFLRQDPDRIMVGEIRDMETARIAIQAALTGHLVFSTLHTNDSAGTVTRLIDMGIEPFLITSSLVAVLAQRLVRKVCKHCKTPFSPTDRDLRNLGIKRDYVGDNPFYYGKGCDSCNGTGYSGRRGIYELLIMTDGIRELIYDKAPTAVIAEKSRSEGMRTLREDGIQAILQGETTIEEVLKYT